VSEVYLVAVEQMPEPLGGMESIKDKIPPSVKSSGIKGTVYVLAYIDENGTVRKVLLSKGVGGEADQAALNAVRRTHFRAGRKAGVPVKVQTLIAILF
jgi:TonB family protein